MSDELDDEKYVDVEAATNKFKALKMRVHYDMLTKLGGIVPISELKMPMTDWDILVSLLDVDAVKAEWRK